MFALLDAEKEKEKKLKVDDLAELKEIEMLKELKDSSTGYFSIIEKERLSLLEKKHA